jgi:hypothetical protein
MQRRRRRANLRVPEGLDFVLERSGENRFARSTPPIPHEIWVKIVGFRVADRARPVSLDRGLLTLRVSTSVWANELSMLADSIVSRLRDAGFEVQKLRFRVAPIATAERPPERRTSRKVPPPAPLPKDLGERIATIDDPELRAIMATCASESLAWGAAAADITANNAPSRARPPAPATIPPGEASSQRNAANRSKPSKR